MFYRYEHYMSISHMALIVATVHIPRFLCSLYVLSLWTLYVYFAHCVNCGYSTHSEIPMFFICSIVMNIICTISHIALIVAIVHIPRFLCSLYVLSLWTLYVYFAHGVNCGYSTLQRDYPNDFFTNIKWYKILFLILYNNKIRYRILYHFTPLEFFTSWLFFTGVWVTASLLKSPGLFSVFWSTSIML